MDSIFKDIATVTILPEYERREYFKFLQLIHCMKYSQSYKAQNTEYKKASQKNRKAFAFDAQSQFILLNQPGS